MFSVCTNSLNILPIIGRFVLIFFSSTKTPGPLSATVICFLSLHSLASPTADRYITRQRISWSGFVMLLVPVLMETVHRQILVTRQLSLASLYFEYCYKQRYPLIRYRGTLQRGCHSGTWSAPATFPPLALSSLKHLSDICSQWHIIRFCWITNN